MIDLGISKLALIGAVALIVIGPEKLPKVARTVGALLGKAQRYVSDVKAEVNRSMELEELRKMKDGFQGAMNDAKSSVESAGKDFEDEWKDVTGNTSTAPAGVSSDDYGHIGSSYNSYVRPKKRWRAKRAAVPQWYKARSGQRSHIQSGAARVARFRPQINRISL
ncbi:MAG: Sec-independent protein translocase protein TatB [Burkholderiaceae bacterium]|jgi:sec-independent protein translocase protein TatB